jgi:hypothetical protein
VESDGGRDGEGREGWRGMESEGGMMEGRGSDGGGGNDGAGPSLSTVGARRLGAGGRRWPYALAIRRWGCSKLSFVGGGARSGCWAWFVGTGFPFVGAELSFMGGGTRSRAVHVCGCWVRGRCTFVGGGLLFVGAGLSFVGAVVPCRVSW